MSPVAEGVVWAAAAGLCLRILGLRWAIWLMLPAAMGLALTLLLGATADLPLWLRASAIALGAVFALILAIRGGRAVLLGLVGDDAAARTVGGWLRASMGSPGHSRQVRRAGPRLPRQAPPFNPRDLGGPP